MQTTEADFELFKSEFLRWSEQFGCIGWEILFAWEALDGHDAEVWPDWEGKVVVVKFNTEISREGTGGIKLLAFHEAVELLLAPLRLLAQGREFSVTQLNTETHQVVNVLARLLL